MGVIEIVKKGFQVTFKSKPVILALFGFGFIRSVLNAPFASQAQGLSLSLIVLTIVFFLISVFMEGGLLGYLRDMIKGGGATLETFKKTGVAVYLRLLSVAVIVVIFVGIVSILAMLVFLISGESFNALTLILASIIAFAGIFGVFLVFLAPYIIVIEDARVIDSLKGSKEIVCGNLTFFAAFMYFVFFTLMTVLVIPMAIFLLVYLFHTPLRESRFCNHNIVKIYMIGLLLVIVGLLVGIVFGKITDLLTGMLQGTFGLLIFSFFSSAIEALLHIVMTASYMTYFLDRKSSNPSQEAPSAA